MTTDTATESESDSDKVYSGPATPAGLAPPPPLRNIPHQTPDASPTTSQLFSQPGAWPIIPQQPMLRPATINQPKKHIKLPTKISVVPNASELNQTPFADGFHTPMSESPTGSNRVSSELSTPSQPLGVTHNSNTQGQLLESNLRTTPPVHTSTPKTNRLLFSDRADGKSDEGGKNILNISTQKNTSREDVEKSMQRLVPPQPQSAFSEVKSVSKRKPPRAPSRHLQQNLSRQSTSESTDDDTLSDDSDKSEGRDDFDPGMHYSYSNYNSYNTFVLNNDV